MGKFIQQDYNIKQDFSLYATRQLVFRGFPGCFRRGIARGRRGPGVGGRLRPCCVWYCDFRLKRCGPFFNRKTVPKMRPFQSKLASRIRCTPHHSSVARGLFLIENHHFQGQFSILSAFSIENRREKWPLNVPGVTF